MLNNAVLTFTPTSWSTVQTLRLSVVRNKPTGERGNRKRLVWKCEEIFMTSLIAVLAQVGLGPET